MPEKIKSFVSQEQVSTARTSFLSLRPGFYLQGQVFTLSLQVPGFRFDPLPWARSPGRGKAVTSQGTPPCPLPRSHATVSYQAKRDMA